MSSLSHPQSQRLLASCSTDSSICLIAISPSKHFQIHSTLQDHEGAITCLASSSDGHLLASGGKDHSIRLWSIPAGKFLRCVEDFHTPQGKHVGSITALCFAGEQLITAGMDGCVKCFQLGATHSSMDAVEEELGTLSLDDLLDWGSSASRSVGVGFGDIGGVGVGGGGNMNGIGDTGMTDKLLWSVAVEESGVAHLAFDAARKQTLVSTGEHEVRLLDGRLATTRLRLRSQSGAVTAVVLDRWCQLVAGSADHSVMVCDGASDAVVAWREEATAVSTLAAAGSWVVVPGPAYSLRVLNSAWEECCRLEGHREQITAVAMDASTVVSSSSDVGKNGGSEG